jgi:hypothetical protein
MEAATISIGFRKFIVCITYITTVNSLMSLTNFVVEIVSVLTVPPRVILKAWTRNYVALHQSTAHGPSSKCSRLGWKRPTT